MNDIHFTLIESFSGPGGMGLGLKNAGFDLLYAFDINEAAVNTHNNNLGNKCYQRNATDITGKELLNKLKLKRGDLTLFAGGPPCQGFSKQKKGAHLGDKRNDLVLEYIRLVNELYPSFFIFENVAIFGQKRGLKYVHAMEKQFNDYSLYPKFYNCADYGLGQTRERFIIVGKRNDIFNDYATPMPTVKKRKTIKDIIGDLPEPPMDYTAHPSFPNHQRAKVTEINIERFSHVPQGGGWQDIPFDLRLESHKRLDTSKGGWPDVYGRLNWDGQCPTITGGFDSFTRGRFGHPEYNRPITPREAARIQGFPDSFVFTGNRGDTRSQIGNAVPPPLAEVIGKSIIKCLKNSMWGTVDPILEKNLKMA